MRKKTLNILLISSSLFSFLPKQSVHSENFNYYFESKNDLKIVNKPFDFKKILTFFESMNLNNSVSLGLADYNTFKKQRIIAKEAELRTKIEADDAKSVYTIIPPVLNYMIYKGDKETLKFNITHQHLNLLKELKEHVVKRKSLNTAENKINDINKVSEQLKNTVTGSSLAYKKPVDKTFEDALSFKVSKMLSKIANDEKSKNKIASPSIIQAIKDDRQSIKKEVTDLCREVLIKSVKHSDDYYTFYHGHGNGLRLYFDILREIKSFETICNLDSTSPLRDKSSQSIGNTVEEILSNYEDKALDYAARNSQKLYDLSRGMGVGFAPDKIEYFRDHVISVNPNLFGNMNVLAECTLFYWLDSFNISNPNEALVKNLLMRIATHLPEDKITERMAQYTELYNDFMKETGGNLMQIHVHKSIVDEISYVSWMKGIPVLLNKDTHKLATRGSNSKPVPVLTDHENEYERPKTSDYLDLLTNDPNQFIKKYSDFSKKKVIKRRDLEECLDRPQARIVVNPNYFNDPDLVKVNYYTRFKPSEEALTNYQQKLKGFIQEDMNAYLKQLQSGSIKGQPGDRLTKLTKFIEEGTEFYFNNEQIRVPRFSQIKEE